MAEPAFVPGLELGRLFYEQAVRPVLREHFGGIEHAAALIGHGSEVIGCDDEVSTDHHWGPRVMLFLREADHAQHAEAVGRMLGEKLPRTFMGYSTHFGEPDALGVQLRAEAGDGPIRHRVEALTVRGFFADSLGIDTTDELSHADWLAMPQQELLMLTAGCVYHDGPGELTSAREKLAWFPRDVWLSHLACRWRKVEEAVAFVGRCAQRGDELGSWLVAARIVRQVMYLCFLMEKCYAPYAKWFGVGFGRLACGPELGPMLRRVLEAGDYPAREAALCAVYERIGAMHNELGITEPVPVDVSDYHQRPFKALKAEPFVKACEGAIKDATIRAMGTGAGPIDALVDDPALMGVAWWRKIRSVYEGEHG